MFCKTNIFFAHYRILANLITKHHSKITTTANFFKNTKGGKALTNASPQLGISIAVRGNLGADKGFIT